MIYFKNYANYNKSYENLSELIQKFVAVLKNFR